MQRCFTRDAVRMQKHSLHHIPHGAWSTVVSCSHLDLIACTICNLGWRQLQAATAHQPAPTNASCLHMQSLTLLTATLLLLTLHTSAVATISFWGSESSVWARWQMLHGSMLHGKGSRLEISGQARQAESKCQGRQSSSSKHSQAYYRSHASPQHTCSE